MPCINEGEPITPRIKFKTIEKFRDQKYISEQAYLVPENNGCAVYLSYELNRTLENVFNKYSTSGYMGVNGFIKMCYDYNLLPKYKNKDTLYYIFKSSKSSSSRNIEYKHFFQILQRLSAYLFRKLIMTEQEKLNVLIKHLTSLKNIRENVNHQKYNVGVQVSVKKESRGNNTVCDMVDECCGTVIETKSVGTLSHLTGIKDDISIGMDKKNNKLDINKDNINSFTLQSEKSEKLEIKERINEIEKKYSDTEDINKKLKEEIYNALKIIEEKNVEIEDINKNKSVQLEIEKEKVSELKNEIQKLQNEKHDFNLKVTERNSLLESKKSKHLTKGLLILPGEEEAELMKVFSIYSKYCGEIVEYVMSKTLCANFLATYYLLKKDEKNRTNGNIDIRTSEKLFNEVLYKKAILEKTDESGDVLTYFYFKLFLSAVGNYLYPELTERESFLEIVLNYVLFLKKNEDFIRWKEENTKVKTNNNKMIVACSNELTMFEDDIVGGYTSSEKSVTCNSVNKKGKIKLDMITTEKRRSGISKSGYSNSDNNNENLIVEKLQIGSFITDQSFEFIESSETKKKSKKLKEKKTKNKMEKINYNNNNNGNNSKYNYDINCLKKEGEHKGIGGYASFNENYKSIESYRSNDFHFSSRNEYRIKPLKLNHNFLTTPKKVHRNSTTANTKKNKIFQNFFPLYDIEGELWQMKSEKTKKFVPHFGNE
ncbi:conserved Plasmodium protein, unknown function [Plasmodium malariae]|uniref:Uncharacterized protein n=2 Tax=Plasmodium malariae TaxID=5858 RepID=A0A1D3TEZ9_PLAMA|nr:conserved Plasmodium protein, unknown function [Plasmodium malariae]SCP03497.1 conserved Plasmodium protein, unknown function [Plasmodium malariae]